MLKEGLDVKTNEGSFPQSADLLMESFTLMTSSPPLITEILKMTSKGKNICSQFCGRHELG